jgi:hypothetical protein
MQANENEKLSRQKRNAALVIGFFLVLGVGQQLSRGVKLWVILAALAGLTALGALLGLAWRALRKHP